MLIGLEVGDELGELLFQQLILGFEARDEAEDLLQDLAQRQATVHGGGFAQLVEDVRGRIAFLEETPARRFEQLVDLDAGCGFLIGHSGSNLSDGRLATYWQQSTRRAASGADFTQKVAIIRIVWRLTYSTLAPVTATTFLHFSTSDTICAA